MSVSDLRDMITYRGKEKESEKGKRIMKLRKTSIYDQRAFFARPQFFFFVNCRCFDVGLLGYLSRHLELYFELRLA